MKTVPVFTVNVVLFAAGQAITVGVDVAVNKVLEALDDIVEDIISAAVDVIEVLVVVQAAVVVMVVVVLKSCRAPQIAAL